jgi:ubiquinone/menaquinone biosynthesis C-methylase UbiE
MSVPRRLKWVLGTAAAAFGALFLWRKYTTPFPYRLRSWISVETPGLSNEFLRELLDPQPGERILEVGPGVGLYTLPAARWLANGATLDTLDLQQEMLDETMRRAAEEGINNITPTRGDATDLPYADASFDASFMVTALGEMPDKDAVLRELRRVTKPHGRVVIGEFVPDLHGIRLSALRRHAEEGGLEFDRSAGNLKPIAYFARFLPQG